MERAKRCVLDTGDQDLRKGGVISGHIHLTRDLYLIGIGTTYNSFGDEVKRLIHRTCLGFSDRLIISHVQENGSARGFQR